MRDEFLLPDNDQDLLLARRIGKRLEGDSGLVADGEEDSFLRILAGLKAIDSPRIEPKRREVVWARIQDQMSTTRPIAIPKRRLERAPRPSLRLLRLSPARRWAAVAATVVALIAVAWLLRPTGPTLVASTGSEAFAYTTVDGSKITLRPHTKLFALTSSGSDVRYRLEGEAFFDVTHNPARRFSVEANNGRVSVLGTRFNVSSWGMQTTVYLEEGRVRFEKVSDGSNVVLAPGQRSSLSATGELEQPLAADGLEYLDWMRDQMVFEHRPLDRILAEMSQHYGITFDVPATLDEETLTGRILLADVDQAVRDLGAVLGGHFVKTGPSVYRFTRSP